MNEALLTVLISVGAIIASTLYNYLQLSKQGAKVEQQSSQLKTVKTETESLAETIQKQAQQIVDLKEENEQRTATIKRLEQAAVERETKRKEEFNRLEISNRERAHAYELQLEHQKGQVEELSKQNAQFQEDRKGFIERETRLTIRLEEFEKQITDIKEANNRQSLELQSVRGELSQVKDKNTELAEQHIQDVATIQRLETRIVHLETENQRLRGERPALVQLKETNILSETPTPKPEPALAVEPESRPPSGADAVEVKV